MDTKFCSRKLEEKLFLLEKIKFEFPTLIEISPNEDEILTEEIEKKTIAPAVQEATKGAENNPAVTAVTKAIT